MNPLRFLFGEGEKTQQFQRLNPQQQQLANLLSGGAQQVVPQGFDFLSQLLSPQVLNNEMYERPAMRQFEEEILPSIAERFTQFGSGSQRSSAFGQQLGQAGSALAERLAAGRLGRQQSQQQLGLAGLDQLQGLLGHGLNPQFDTRIKPAEAGFIPSLAQPAATLGLLSLLGGI